MNLKDKRLIFVTGKGGVGKSLLAASIALQEASKGRKVCLVELGQQSFYEAFFETRGIGYEPSEVIPQVHISLLSPEEALKEYILHYLKVAKLYEILFQNKVMKAFINAAPALPELSILGKLTSDIRGVISTDYDLIVVDCFSTGHALALLRAPRGLKDTFKVGPLNEQARNIDQVLCNNELVKYIVVTLPEELPVNEAKELVTALRADFNGDVSVICNQISNSGLSDAEKQSLKGQISESGAQEFLEYVIQKEAAQKKNIEKLTEAFGEFWGVNLILKNIKGQELIENVVPQIGETVGFDELLTTKKVIICCGSGGVGKTTISASLAVRAAQLGKRALVMTIDPARRLANSLGLESLQEMEKRVPGDFPGELYAEMLDMKRTFDDFIKRLAPSPDVAQKVLDNHIYQQLSTALNGSQEYTALERLLVASSSGHFDIIILDTPPTKHAIDFLNAPAKIHTLFQESIMKWFLMPFSTLDKLSLGLMNRGTKMGFKLLEKVAGSEFISMINEFFSVIRDWQKTLRDRTAEVHRLLTSSSTGFVLVTGFNAVKIEEARYFERSLKKGGYLLSAIVVNRAFPLWNEELKGDNKDWGGEVHASAPQGSSFDKLKIYYHSMKNYFERHLHAYRDFEMDLRGQLIFARLPDLDQDIHDIKGLVKIAQRLSETGEKR